MVNATVWKAIFFWSFSYFYFESSGLEFDMHVGSREQFLLVPVVGICYLSKKMLMLISSQTEYGIDE